MGKIKMILDNKILKNILIMLISLILATFIFIGIIFITESNKYNTYQINIKDNKNVVINEIWVNGSKKSLLNLVEQSNIEGEIVNNKLVLKENIILKIPQTYEFNIIFEKNNETNNIIVSKNDKENTIDLNSDEHQDYLYIFNNSSNRFIVTNYLKHAFNINHIIISLISIIIFFITIKYILKFLNNIKNDEISLKKIILYFCCCFIILISVEYIIIEISNKLFQMILGAILICGLIYLKSSLKNKLHLLFIYLLIPIGISFALAMPIDHVPDENAHFFKSYIVSNKLLYNDLDKDNNYCINANDSMNKILSEYNYDIFNYNYTLKARAFYSNIDETNKSDNNNSENCYLNVQKLPFVAYSITTISLMVSQLLNLPILLMYILGRLSNLLFYILIIYCCIKKICKYKKSLFIISTLPIAIQAAGAFNQDCVHNALFILLFTLIINEINKEDKIKLNNILIIIIISVLLGFCKLGYFSLIFLCLLIPKKRFNTKKEHFIYKLLMITPILITFVILYFVNWNQGIIESSNNNVYTIFSLFKDPLDFIRLYLNSINNWWFYMGIQGLMDGFAVSTKYNSTLTTFILAIAYTIMLLSKNEEKNTKSYIITTIFSSIFIIFLIMTSMLGQNQIGVEHIDGLQPRYFIPAILLLFTTINITKIKIKLENTEFTWGILIVLIYIGVLTTIIKGFYL